MHIQKEKMDFPDWYLKEKESARLGLKNAKPAKYGVDIDSLKLIGKILNERDALLLNRIRKILFALVRLSHCVIIIFCYFWRKAEIL